MEEWFLVLDNFDGYVTFFLCIVGLHHLTKGALADQGVDFIPENIKKLEKILQNRLDMLKINLCLAATAISSPFPHSSALFHSNATATPNFIIPKNLV